MPETLVDAPEKLHYKPAPTEAALWLPVCFLRPAVCRIALIEKDTKRGIMANTSSAKKAARKMVRKAAINKNRRSRVRTYVRQVEEALASGDKAAAEAAFKAAQPELMRAASKGVLHSNTASRKVSRLAQRVKSLSA